MLDTHFTFPPSPVVLQKKSPSITSTLATMKTSMRPDGSIPDYKAFYFPLVKRGTFHSLFPCFLLNLVIYDDCGNFRQV